MPSPLEQAVIDWIKADYEYYHGNDRYSDESREEQLRSEVRLRRLVTGKGQLVEARMTMIDDPPMKKHV